MNCIYLHILEVVQTWSMVNLKIKYARIFLKKIDYNSQLGNYYSSGETWT